MKKNSKAVYSTESGRIVEKKGRKDAVPAKDEVVRIRREVKGRRGKTVTTVSGIPLHGAELIRMVKEIKQRLGSGGSLKDGIVILQGDHCESLLQYFEERGIKARRSGG